MTTEQKKHAMYYDLACLKGQKKHPKLLARFENHLEEYLEGLRTELQMAREASSERAGDAKDLQELRESAGRLIVRNTQLEEALRNQAHDIRVWEGNYDELWNRLQGKQALIVSQRKSIESLTFAFKQAYKTFEKPSFWSFFSRKKNQAKQLPEKTN